MKRILSIMLCLCLLVGMMTGCSSKKEGGSTLAPAETSPSGNEMAQPSAEPEKTTKPGEEVTFWGYWDGEVADQINEIVTAYNEKTGDNVKYICQADMMNAFQASAIAGDVPDVMLWDASEVRRYAKLGQLMEQDSYIEKAGVPKSDFNDESIRELTVEDKLYGLPMNLDIWGVYVNMDILKKAGIEKAPATWDEIKAAAEASMKVEGVKVGINLKMAPYLFNSFLVANNGKPLSDDGLMVNLDDRALEVLNYFKELIDSGVYTTKYAPSNGSDGFITGEEAMALWPTSMLRTYRTYGDKMDFTFIPIPQGRAENAVAGGTQTSWSMVVPKAAKHPDVALSFIEYALHNDENSLIWCDIVGGFSALKSVQNDSKFLNDKYLKNIIAGLENCQIRSDVPGFINLEGTCYGPEIEKMFEGGQSPEDTLKVMKTEGDKLLEQYRGNQ